MRRTGLLLAAVLAAVYLPAIGDSSSGTHPDEAWHLGTSAEMMARGEWFTPMLDGEPNWHKPPLFHWAQLAAYGVLGTNLLAARLPSALAWMAVVLLVLSLGRRMYGEAAGTAAAFLTATAFGWVKYARLAMMDSFMALGLAIAAWATWKASEEDEPAWLLGVGVGAGVDFMVKGPVGAVLVLLLSGGFLAVRNRPLLHSRWTAGAFLLGAAIGLPWYVASLAIHGRAFYDFFVVRQNVDRFMHPWTLRGEATLLVGFLVFSLPWTFLFLSGLRSLRAWREPGVLLPLAWILSVLVTFTVPSLKWPHYGLTAIPAAMLLAVRTAPAAWARASTAVVLGAGAVAALLALRWPLPPVPAVAAGVAAAGLGASAALSWRGRLVPAAVGVGVAFSLIAGLVVPGVNPPAFPAAAVAASGGRPLWVYDQAAGLFTLDAGRLVRRAWTPAQAEQALSDGGALVATRAQVERFSPGVRERLVKLASWRRIPGYLPPERAWRAWRDRSPPEMYEDMDLVALLPGGDAPSR
ncbi:MAG TPA: glycosyltransferase family 39 protein [Anaeromyxobacteraceae bacterium]|nr:glycosyltransferase family 39 protein [Anaeromyxobacteraceae bacterium]